MEPVIADLAKNDPKRLVKADAINILAEYGKKEYEPLFKAAANDSSYTVAGNALQALFALDADAATAEAKHLITQPAKGALATALTDILSATGDESFANNILDNFEKMPFSQAKIDAVQSLAVFIAKAKNTDIVKRGVDAMASFRDSCPQSFQKDADQLINDIIFKAIAKRKNAEGLKEQADYILSKTLTERKKGF
jgi:aminopeptidase N